MMPVFGSYKTERLLLRSGRESFWMARDGSGRACALQIMEHPDVWDDDQKTEAARDFLRLIEHQKKLGEETGGVAKVLDSGTDEKGAFAALEPAAESLSRVINARTILSSGALRKFTFQFLQVIGALQKQNRAHGNLHAESVLLSTANLQTAKPLLVSATPNAGPDDDLPALGRILFQLIQHREFSYQSGIDAEGTEENWKRQEDGDAWKHFITAVLLPDPGTTADTLRKSVPGGGIPSWVKPAAGVLCALAILGAGGYWWMNHKTVTPKGDDSWQSLASVAAAEVLKEPDIQAAAASATDASDPSAKFWVALKTIASDKAEVEGKYKEIENAPSEITGQIGGQFLGGQDAAYPNFAAIVQALKVSSDKMKDGPTNITPSGFQAYFENAGQFAAIQSRLKAMNAELKTGGGNLDVLGRVVTIIIDHDCPAATLSGGVDDRTMLSTIVSEIKGHSTSYEIALSIKAANNEVVWAAITPKDFPPTYEGLKNLNAALKDYHKEPPADLVSQAQSLKNSIKAKIVDLNSVMTSSDADAGDKANATATLAAYNKAMGALDAEFFNPPPVAGEHFGGSPSIYWIHRDYPAIQKYLDGASLASYDRTTNDLTDKILKKGNWIQGFLASGDAKQTQAFFTYYCNMQNPKLPTDPEGWTPAMLKAHRDVVPVEFSKTQQDYKRVENLVQNLKDQVPTNAAGIEQAFYQLIDEQIKAVSDGVESRGVAYTPSAGDAWQDRITRIDNELKYKVNVQQVSKSLSGTSFDINDITVTSDNLARLETLDPKAAPLFASFHQFARALTDLTRAPTIAPAQRVAAFKSALDRLSGVKLPDGTAPKPEAVEAITWKTFDAVKAPDLELTQYELSHVTSRDTPENLVKFLARSLPDSDSDTRANMVLEQFLGTIIQKNDAKVAGLVSAELAKLPSPSARIKAIIPALTVDAAAVAIAPPAKAGLLEHGWTEQGTTDKSDLRTFDFQNKIQLSFKKLDNTSTYLCTTETPLKLLLILSEDERYSLLSAKINVDKKEFKPATFKDAQVNITYEANAVLGFQNEKSIIKEAWGSTGAADSIIHQPAAPIIWGAPSAPTLDHPLQFVSPATAAYLAHACGCRLPSAAEWASADAMNRKTSASDYATNAADALLAGPALDDYNATYLKEYLDQNAASNLGLPLNLTAGVFPMPNAPAANPRRPAAPRVDDLLFRPVATGDVPFQNLIGNVAEFVIDDSLKTPLSKNPALDAKIAAIKAATSDSARIQATKDVLTTVDTMLPNKVKVIGGSCLSPLAKVEDARTAQPDADPTKAFTDVGFRMAFDTTSVPTVKPAGDQIAEKLRKIPTNILPDSDLVKAILPKANTGT